MDERENEALKQGPDREADFLDGFDGEEPQAEEEQARAEEQSQEPAQADVGVPEEEGLSVREQPGEESPAPGQQTAREQTVREQVSRGLAEFAKAFPEAYHRAKEDPDAIPEAVWADVRAGMSLTAAYARYTVGQTARARQSQVNAQRATGSMRSAGSDSKNKDPFLEGWDE